MIAPPIFRDDDFDNVDETWQHGAFIGGMVAGYADAGLAEDYRRAADALVERSLRDDSIHEIVMPVLFLYRHAIELRLKSIARPEKLDHNLQGLVSRVNTLLAEAGGSELARDVVKRIGEISGFDPAADAFRFTHARRKKHEKRPEMHFINEVWVDVRLLRSVVAEIDQALLEASARLAGTRSEPNAAATSLP